MSDATAERVQRYWALANARDWAGFGSLLGEDIVYEVPQTRERVRGRAAYVEFNSTWPGAWCARVDSVIAEDQKAVSVITFTVDGESMTGISFFELQDQLIVRITDYWPDPYEPPPRMTSVIERY